MSCDYDHPWLQFKDRGSFCVGGLTIKLQKITTTMKENKKMKSQSERVQKGKYPLESINIKLKEQAFASTD